MSFRSLFAGIRNGWRALTSMRTALVLLFLLALAAIPGALLPQRSINQQKVTDYLAEHSLLGPWMDRLQLFDVFRSFWFTAIYALLFISLVGCILPRTVEHYRALRRAPVPAPRNLSRLPKHTTVEGVGTPQEIISSAAGALRGWRCVERTENCEKIAAPENTEEQSAAIDSETSAHAVTLSAEKGYTRELGNLVFHLALVGLLLAVAVGRVFGYEGTVIVLADDGPGFCTTSPAVFDSFRAGNGQDGTHLTPICTRVKNFHADYLPDGQADMFTADIAYQAGKDVASNTWRDTTIRVNHPLRVAGNRIYLQGHGYAPSFTVTFPDGRTRSETVQWQPTDARTFLSMGVVRIDPPAGLYPEETTRRQNQIAIDGLFAPTASFQGTLLTSSFPAANDPAVAVDIYRGDTGLDTGRAQSLFALDPEMLHQGRLVKQARVNLRPGQSTTLPGNVQVRFDGAKQFVNLQVSRDPTQGWVLGAAVIMVLGLVVSLVVPRRRIWLRATPTADPRRSVVEMGGLSRTDRAGWGSEFERLSARLLPVRGDE